MGWRPYDPRFFYFSIPASFSLLLCLSQHGIQHLGHEPLARLR